MQGCVCWGVQAKLLSVSSVGCGKAWQRGMLQALCKLQALLGYISPFPAGFAPPAGVLGQQGSAAGVSMPVDGSLHFWCLVFSFSRAVLPWQLTVVSVHSPP